jgi:hypothetical protein
MKRLAVSVIALCTLGAPAFAAESLKLNPKLSYTSDSHDGSLSRQDLPLTSGLRLPARLQSCR